jgi:hypothetical protein
MLGNDVRGSEQADVPLEELHELAEYPLLFGGVVVVLRDARGRRKDPRERRAVRWHGSVAERVGNERVGLLRLERFFAAERRRARKSEPSV